MTNAEKKSVFLKLFTIASIVAVLNILFLTSFIPAIALVVFESLILFYLFLKKKIVDYICFLLIVVCNCIEFTVFTGGETAYSFKNFRILGINLVLIALVPLILYGLFHIRKNPSFKKTRGWTFLRYLIIINLFSFVIGLFLLIANNNGILVLSGIFRIFFQKAYAMMAIPLAFGLPLLMFMKEPSTKYKIIITLQVVLLADVVQLLFARLFGINGSYGYLSTLQNSVISFLLPLLILARFNREKIIYSTFTTVMGFVGIALLLLFNANGKIIIISAISLVLFVILSIKYSGVFVKCSIAILMIIALFVVPAVIIVLRENPLYNAKFEDVLSLLNIFSDNWVENLSLSPRVRVEEFKDVLYEFGKNPLFALFGKGYLGSILDHTGFFGETIVSADGFVTEDEWNHQIFYSLHEGSSYLVTYGIAGIFFLVYVLIGSINNYLRTRNYLALIGAYWFILFYGYSVTISCFGFVALIISFCDERIKQNKPIIEQETAILKTV